MIRAASISRDFRFHRPAVTSRGTYLNKKVSFVLLWRTSDTSLHGIGECSLFPGLSHDDHPHFEEFLHQTIDQINHGSSVTELKLEAWPSIRFALETAMLDLDAKGTKILYPSAFTEGRDCIPINGLIWMGDKRDMVAQIRTRLDEGFRCLKMKVGALGLKEEMEMLRDVRRSFGPSELEIRIDANGAFNPDEAPAILEKLSALYLHSIEQPIARGQHEEMAQLCAASPVPIALDEELIGINGAWNRKRLLDVIKPQYIVLKPGLLGGLASCEEWIGLARERQLGWWITSSLETNIGLNAIAQWTYGLQNNMYQGLSTGSLFKDNFPSSLFLRGDRLCYDPDRRWDTSLLDSP